MTEPKLPDEPLSKIITSLADLTTLNTLEQRGLCEDWIRREPVMQAVLTIRDAAFALRSELTSALALAAEREGEIAKLNEWKTRANSVANEAADLWQKANERAEAANARAEAMSANAAMRLRLIQLHHTDAMELWKALNDLSFECDAVFNTQAPSRETYNRTFEIQEKHRQAYSEAAKENTADMHSKGRCGIKPKTHCVNGHAFTPENTSVFKGMRQCKECGRNRGREYQRNKRKS